MLEKKTSQPTLVADAETLEKFAERLPPLVADIVEALLDTRNQAADLEDNYGEPLEIGLPSRMIVRLSHMTECLSTAPAKVSEELYKDGTLLPPSSDIHTHRTHFDWECVGFRDGEAYFQLSKEQRQQIRSWMPLFELVAFGIITEMKAEAKARQEPEAYEDNVIPVRFDAEDDD